MFIFLLLLKYCLFLRVEIQTDMDKWEKDKKKVFILITTLLTWARTKGPDKVRGLLQI